MIFSYERSGGVRRGGLGRGTRMGVGFSSIFFLKGFFETRLYYYPDLV